MKWFDLFPALFFASATTFVDGGSADVDSGGGSAPGADTVEPAAEEVSAESEPVETGDVEPAEPKVETERADTKPVTADEIKKGLAELRKSNPRLAEALRKEYYGAGDYKQIFPSVQAARDFRDQVEAVTVKDENDIVHSGLDALPILEKEAQDYADELKAMAQGNPSVVDALATDFPDALPKLAPYAVEKWRQIDEPGYERFAAGVIAGTLRDKGVEHLALRLQELIIDGKQKDAAALAGNLRDWISGISEFAKTQPQQTGEHPEVKRARELESETNRKAEALFKGEVAKSMIGSMNEAITKLVDPLIRDKKLKLTNEQRKGIINEARGLLSQEFQGLTPYQNKMKSLLAQGDQRAIERYLASQLTHDRVNKAVKSAWSARGFSAARPAPTNGNAAVRVNAKPKAEQIDWSQDPRRERFQRGEATLKKEYGGKVVKWDWDTV